THHRLPPRPIEVARQLLDPCNGEAWHSSCPAVVPFFGGNSRGTARPSVPGCVCREMRGGGLDDRRPSNEDRRLRGRTSAQWRDTMVSTVQHDTSSDRSASEAARAEDIAQALSALRGVDASAAMMYELAERLKNVNEFGYARRLYGRIRMRGDYGG